MGIMDQEKLFSQENHEMSKRLLMTCCEKMAGRKLHGYYADNKEEALNIMSTLLNQFGEELGGGEIDWNRRFPVGAPDWQL